MGKPWGTPSVVDIGCELEAIKVDVASHGAYFAYEVRGAAGYEKSGATVDHFKRRGLDGEPAPLRRVGPSCELYCGVVAEQKSSAAAGV